MVGTSNKNRFLLHGHWNIQQDADEMPPSHHGVLGAAAGFSPHFLMVFCVKNQTVQSGAPKIAKLVYNSNNYGLWYL